MPLSVTNCPLDEVINRAYARNVVTVMLVYREQKISFGIAHQHGRNPFVVRISGDWSHTLSLTRRINAATEC